MSGAVVINVAESETLVSITFSSLPAGLSYNKDVIFYSKREEKKHYSFLNMIANLSVKGQVAR